MRLDKNRMKKAGRYTLICCLCIAAVEAAGAFYLVVLKNVPLREALPAPFAAAPLTAVILHIIGIVLFFFWIYFFESEKRESAEKP